MAAAAESSHYFPGSDDIETASIHSDAPSYASDAPSYHTIASQPEPIPPYTPPGTATTSHSTNVTQPGVSNSHSSRSTAPVDTLGPSSQPRTTGLPPVPPGRSTTPQLDQFRIPTWSAIHSNPTYHNVARRRARGNAKHPASTLRRAILLERETGDEDLLSSRSSASPSLTSSSRYSQRGSSSASESAPRRPLEDPHLVGETAAEEARQARIARERVSEMLAQEDRQWNWFVTQMGDWEERHRSWTRSRQGFESRQRANVPRRLA